MSSNILFPVDNEEGCSERSLRDPIFHCSQTLSYLSIPSPYSGSNFPALAAACAAMVAALTGHEAIRLSWGLWIALFIGLFLMSSVICYWHSGNILLNRYSNFVDIEKRLSRDLRARKKSSLSEAEEGNLKAVLYKLNVQRSDLNCIGFIRHISPGYRKIESSLNRLRSSIENLGVYVSDDDILFMYQYEPYRREFNKLDKRFKELISVVKKISES